MAASARADRLDAGQPQGQSADALDGTTATVPNDRWRKVICDSQETWSLETKQPAEGAGRTSGRAGEVIDWRRHPPRKPALTSSRKSSFPVTAELCRHASRPCDGPYRPKGNACP